MTVAELFRRFLPYSWRHRRIALICVATALLGPLLSVALLWITKGLIDEVFILARTNRLGFFLGGYVAILAAKVAVEFVEAQLDARATAQVENDVRSDLFSHVVRLPPGTLAKCGPGDLISHMSGDVGRVEYLVFSGPVAVITNVATALCFFVFLFTLSWKLTLLALVAAPVLAFTSLRASPKVRRLARTARRLRARWTADAEERLNALPMIQAFGAEDFEAGRFRRRCHMAQEAELRGVAVQARLSAVNGAAAAVAAVALITLGALEVRSLALSVGAVVAFLGSVGSLHGPFQSLARAWGRFQKAAAGAERIAEILDTQSTVAERPGARRLDTIAGAIEFRDVAFAYPGREPVLEDVSFRIEAGETVALVGSSGAGKSTLARLLVRTHDPLRGAVLLDGCDLRELTRDTLVRATCAVFQDPYILRGSVAETIGYARDLDADEVTRLARAAHAHGFVTDMPGGYTASVGPHGSWLSGGQRQRLALARAFSRDCPVLVLDEATAAVDSETEELIQDAMERLSGRRTLVLIGHRLSSIRRADRIVVLDQGRVVETGSPEALLGRPSRCRDLFAAQLAQETELAA